MKRIVLIGNGFDLAHGLKTSYADFINWYWNNTIKALCTEQSNIWDDGLCRFNLLKNHSWKDSWKQYHFDILNKEQIFSRIESDSELFDVTYCTFYKRIKKQYETKGWVDIENEYYDLLTKYAIKEYSIQRMVELNTQLNIIKNKLVEYLNIIGKRPIPVNNEISERIYAPIKPIDISAQSQQFLKNMVDIWIDERRAIVKEKIHRYGLDEEEYTKYIDYFRENYKLGKCLYTDIPCAYLLPSSVMLLSFNYTPTAQLYHREDISFINYIHGRATDNDTPQSIIFGYGDELDDKFKQLQNLNENECLRNIKSIKYLEADNYRQVMSFIESDLYQVYIMGHSCGQSDGTLLNTLFEHKNCISIKPFYYQKEDGTDNYMEIVQNISRNFTDMKLMRDRVVNKTKCEALPQIKRK